MSSVTHGTVFSGPNWPYQPIAQDVRVDGIALHISFVDGRALDVPIAHWTFLAQATSEQRQHWEFEPGNAIIYWPDLDEGLEIAHLLGISEG